MSLASVCRRMTELEQLAVFQRQRKPGGRYLYQLAEAYRPRWPGRAGRGVSAARQGVSQAETTEQAEPTKQAREARKRVRFAKPGLSFSEMPDDRAKWEARLRSWRQSRFWLPLWGPKPSETGCFVPVALLGTAAERVR